jgi:hypothetical protein
MIAVIPKPGKEDYSLPKCYQPVALLECVGKLLEKVVVKWLVHNILAHNLIPSTQFSAQPFSSTIDAGLCLTHDIETAHALSGVCGSLLFNIQGFFDNVNHSRLTMLISSLGFTPKICRWTASFLKDRTVQLHFNGFTSEDIDLELGTPQGSPVSLVLSIIYMFPLLLARCWKDMSFLMFVDDGNILTCAPTYSSLEWKLRNFYMECHIWCLRAGLKIEPEKIEIIFFSHTRPNPTLHGPHLARTYLPD